MSEIISDVVWRSPERNGADNGKLARFLDKKSYFGIGIYHGEDRFGAMILNTAEDGIGYIYCEVADIPEGCKDFGFIWQDRNYRIYAGEPGGPTWQMSVQHREPDINKEHTLSDIYGRCVTIKWDEQFGVWIPSLAKFDDLFWDGDDELHITTGRLLRALDSGKVVIREFEPNRLSEVEKELV